MALFLGQFYSEALRMETSFAAILPEKDPGRGFPVLTLLNGAGGDYSGWLRFTSLERYVKNRRLAVLLPNAHLSMYEDMAHGGKYFTYLADEFPRRVAGFFPLSGAREEHFLAGLSMGGMGALKIGMRRPEQYALIGCFSAGHSNYLFRKPAPGTPRERRYFLAYGDADVEEKEAETMRIARNLAREGAIVPRVFHACGAQDPIRKNAHVTRDLFAQIPGNPFQYEYLEPEGRHNWDFWDAILPEFLRRIDAYL